LTSVPRKEISELVATYELHPNLVDIYVEGNFDRDFLNQYLDSASLRSIVSVYSIADIELADSELVSLDLPLGSNKHRVIALSKILDAELATQVPHVKCLVDADFDRVLGLIVQKPYLTYTDYTCMEMYALNIAALGKFIEFTCNLLEQEVTNFLAVASNVLPVQFALRVVVMQLNLNVAILPFDAGLTKKRDLNTFSSSRYISAFVQRNSLINRKTEIVERFAAVKSTHPTDLRDKAHGHDFVALLFEFAWNRGGIRLHNKTDDVVNFGARIVTAGIDFRHMAKEKVFVDVHRSATSR